MIVRSYFDPVRLDEVRPDGSLVHIGRNCPIHTPSSWTGEECQETAVQNETLQTPAQQNYGPMNL